MKLFLILCFLYINLFSSSLEVKYFGRINLQGFEKQELTKKSFVKELYYNKKTKQAIVKLKNNYYIYCTISKYEISKWKQSQSYGKYYNQHIKGNYRCR